MPSPKPVTTRRACGVMINGQAHGPVILARPVIGARGALTGRLDEEVQQRLILARTGHEHVAARARPGEQRLGHPRDEHRRHRGVDRVATLAQHTRSGLRGERMAGRDHALHGGDVIYAG